MLFLKVNFSSGGKLKLFSLGYSLIFIRYSTMRIFNGFYIQFLKSEIYGDKGYYKNFELLSMLIFVIEKQACPKSISSLIGFVAFKLLIFTHKKL